MRKFKAVIVDDDEHAISALQEELELFVPRVEVVGSANSIRSAKAEISIKKPELLFLDIRLNEGLGFEVISDEIAEHTHILFTTAYQTYAIDAIRSHAFDYLLKPVNHNEVNVALDRLEEQLEKMDQSLPRIEIHMNGERIYLKEEDLLYVHAMSNYCKLFIKDSKPLVVSSTLKSMEDLCSKKFLRVHKSYLVNKLYVHRFDSASNSLELSSGDLIPVSVRRKKYVKENL